MYRGNKKMQRRSRRLHNEAKDKPRPWWREDDYVWEPSHVATARQRARWKREECKRFKERQQPGYRGYRWYNDFGVSRSARKRKHAAWHERKPYERPTKT